MKILECTKADYLMQASILPMVLVLGITILAIGMILRIMARKRAGTHKGRRDAMRLLAAVLGIVIIWSSQLPLLRFSYALPFEHEADLVTQIGVVEAVTEPNWSPNYSIGGSAAPHSAEIVTIDGTQYYFLDADGLQPGNKVEFRFFPQSRMVTYCTICS